MTMHRRLLFRTFFFFAIFLLLFFFFGVEYLFSLFLHFFFKKKTMTALFFLIFLFAFPENHSTTSRRWRNKKERRTWSIQFHSMTFQVVDPRWRPLINVNNVNIDAIERVCVCVCWRSNCSRFVMMIDRWFPFFFYFFYDIRFQ